MNRRLFVFLFIAALILVVLAVGWTWLSQPKPVSAEINVYASPVQAGCYLAGANDCRLHLDPFTINLGTSKKLVYFQILAYQVDVSTRVVWDFRPDVSNPAPLSGSTFTPSLPTQDIALTCGKKYQISLQGRDTGDAAGFNLGQTGVITCPTSGLP